jgi:hypothetical protein
MTATSVLRRVAFGMVGPLVLLSFVAFPSAALAAPGVGWAGTSVAYPTNLPPGGGGKIQIDIINTGSAPSAGPITVTDTLPPGLTATKAGGLFFSPEPLSPEEEEEFFGGARWSCAGTTTVTCTSNPAFLPQLPIVPPPGEELPVSERIGIAVEVAPGVAAEGTFPNRISIAGAGAQSKNANPLTISSLQPSFGFADWDIWLSNADGTPDLRAGSHPYAMTVDLSLNERADKLNGTRIADGELRNIGVDLPPGFFGNLAAIPRCTRAQLDGQKPASEFSESCPSDTQIGVEAAGLEFEGTGGNGGAENLAVYNMVPPPGVPAEFAFSLAGIHAFFDATLQPEGGYRLTEHVGNVPQLSVDKNLLTLWGVPADPGHDAQRGPLGFCFHQEEGGCPAGYEPTPFLTLPTSCVGPLAFTVHGVGTWQDESARAESTVLIHDSDGNPEGLTGCDELDFSPTIEARPTVTTADSATGLHVDLHFPQVEEPEMPNEANLKSTVVTLPRGIAVNPAGANGLASCSSAQIGLTSSLGAAKAEYTGEAPRCPQASKIGAVEVDTQLVDHPLAGSVYLAAQGDNPFNSLLAIYVVVEDPQTGVILKIAGEVKPDPATGQLTATFPENPQLPFEDLKVDFFAGHAATLTTPPTCGTYTTNTILTPWTAPEHADAHPSDSFVIGGNCAATEAALPNAPAFGAGTINPSAGSYSPFVLHLARADGSQRISRVDTALPAGLVGKLAGVGECSDAQLAAAAARSNPGEGRLEQAGPGCPLSSEVGTVTVGAGAGETPLSVSGHAYLAGPYKGAPLSLAIITPAVAGPFDLGDVVVRTALYVNPETAQIHAVSDPLPTILQGIPLDVRSIDLDMNRPQFTLNPTHCDPMAVLGSATSTLGNVAALSQRFQVGGCSALAFKPKVALSLKGGTRRHTFPALKAVVTYPPGPGYANIARAQVTLPHSEFLEQGHIRTVCTRVQFAAGAGNGSGCPAASVYGFARAVTPLLDKPLEGPVYLRSSSHKLPDLVAALNGQIDIALAGRVDTGKNGGIRNTFEVVPDAPVTKFTLEMQGGKKGLLVNSEDICGPQAKTHALVHLVSQNGKVLDLKPKIANSCKGAGKKSKGKKKASNRLGTSHR